MTIIIMQVHKTHNIIAVTSVQVQDLVLLYTYSKTMLVHADSLKQIRSTSRYIYVQYIQMQGPVT